MMCRCRRIGAATCSCPRASSSGRAAQTGCTTGFGTPDVRITPGRSNVLHPDRMKHASLFFAAWTPSVVNAGRRPISKFPQILLELCLAEQRFLVQSGAGLHFQAVRLRSRAVAVRTQEL